MSLSDTEDTDDGDTGFQRPNVYTKSLPYGADLEKEATNLFSEIKSNIGRCILLREIRHGLTTWLHHLTQYISLYGFRFTKDDHLYLVKILLELLNVPDLELPMCQRIEQVLTLLLKKHDLLSRDDLVIDWKPLYALYERTLFSNYEYLGMLTPPLHAESTLKTFISHARIYFGVSATQEMLDEWWPNACPFDMMMQKCINYFDLFLPTTLPPHQYHLGYKLWFDKLISIWHNCQNTPTFEVNLVCLFSRLAWDNIGYIDWEPHLPLIFTRLLRSFNLPAGSGVVRVSRQPKTFESVHAVRWIVAIMGGNSKGIWYTERLFKAIESFYHPSNCGLWALKLQQVMMHFVELFVARLHKERYRKPTWELNVKESQRLTDDDITAFVAAIKPVVLLSMFNKFGCASSSQSFQFLGLLRPEMVIPPLIERVFSSLETLTEPHRLTSTMHCIVAVSRSLASHSKFYPLGQSYVIPLLMNSLPGIDPNDLRKCTVTFQLISTFTTLIPLVDCSKAVSVRDDLTDIDQEVCSATASIEDFVLEFMSRCFSLIETFSMEANTARGAKLNSEENLVELALSSTFSSVFTQASPQIYKAALNKLYTFVSTRIFETNISGRYVATMCRSATKVNPTAALALFVPHFSRLILTLTEVDDVLKEENLDNELLFSMQLLSEVVRCDGKALLPYMNTFLLPVLRRIMLLSSQKGLTLATALYRFILRSLTGIYALEFRSSNVQWIQDETFEKNLPIKEICTLVWALLSYLYTADTMLRII